MVVYGGSLIEKAFKWTIYFYFIYLFQGQPLEMYHLIFEGVLTIITINTKILKSKI